VAAVRLVIHLGDGLSCGGYNAAGVELHACYWIVESKGVKDGASPKIPYLEGGWGQHRG
jgi:hypothetical protein